MEENLRRVWDELHKQHGSPGPLLKGGANMPDEHYR